MKRGPKPGTRFNVKTHHKSGTQLYRVWRGIIARCCYPSTPTYRNYGARGIKVCPQWRSDFVAFLDWALANGYKPGLDIDRKDNDGDYSPNNCRFVTHRENMSNRRCNRLLTGFGETKTREQWAGDPRAVVNSDTIQTRITRGWSLESALLTPSKRKVKSI